MFIVFSDLDGTLLDHNTYSYEAALHGLSLLREHGSMLILASSKTFEEMKPIHTELRLTGPFIFENGGGIAEPSAHGEFTSFLLGDTVDELARRLHDISPVIEGRLRPITAMESEEIAGLTGLSHEDSRLAAKRQASLPFIIEGSDDDNILSRINTMLNPMGITATRGGRFFHLSSTGIDKGNAVRFILKKLKLDEQEDIITVGLGDSENDIPLLKTVDRPFVIRKHDRSIMNCGLDAAVETDAAGPGGFTEAIRSLWNH